MATGTAADACRLPLIEHVAPARGQEHVAPSHAKTSGGQPRRIGFVWNVRHLIAVYEGIEQLLVPKEFRA